MMDLQELKQKWNMLDERLTASEVYNKRMLSEILKGKNKTTYDQLRKEATFNLLATFFIATVIIPVLHLKGIFHNTSFYLLEAVCILGIIMVTYRLILLSRFNVMKAPQEQLHNLVNYKRYYIYEMVIGLPLAIIGICFTLFVENTASPIGLLFIALGIAAGAICGWIGWKKHHSTMIEIESNLAELNGYE